MPDKLRYHPEQDRLIKAIKNRRKRFFLIQAGRRSGKTDIPAKCFKDLIHQDYQRHGLHLKDGFYYITAPTFTQVKRIWWSRLKAAIPKSWKKKELEGALEIHLIFGCTIVLVGLDEPKRIEGSKCFGVLADEWADCKSGIYTQNVLPALADTEGWGIFMGVPRPSIEYELLQRLARENPDVWHHFKWSAEDILPESELEIMRSSMDQITYDIEIRGVQTDVQGRVYYSYQEDTHDFEIKKDEYYSPNEPLIFCFDFNVSPGVAVILQEKILYDDDYDEVRFQSTVDVILGEIWVPVNSNTEIIVGEVINQWGDHDGDIHVYGDASGGSDKTSATTGSDWKIISNALNRYYGTEKINMYIKRGNTAVSDRVNATNSRILNANKEVGVILDPKNNPRLKRDLKLVQYLEGTLRKINPKAGGDTTLTHISDAIGYYWDYKFPVRFDLEEESTGGRVGRPPSQRYR